MHCWHYGEGDLGNSCNMSLSLSWWYVAADLIHRGSMSLGGAYPLPLMSKGENEAEVCEVAIKSKGEIVGITFSGVVLDGNSSGKALSLMKIKKDAGNRFRKCAPAGIPCRNRVQGRRPAVQGVRPPSAHISRQRKARGGFLCGI